MSSPSYFVELKKVAAGFTTPPSFFARLKGTRPTELNVLRDISFRLQAGEQITLFGPEAAGKSTLLRLLAGALRPSKGTVLVNGQAPHRIPNSAAGYVSSEETEPRGETALQILHAFGQTHGFANLPSRLGELIESLKLTNILHRPVGSLSTIERLRLNLAKAALSKAPVILLDDVADALGPDEIKKLGRTVFDHRTLIVATRVATTADALALPILILEHGTLARRGTLTELAEEVNCPATVDIYVEGLRYGLLRRIKNHPGVKNVRLLPSTDFAGQRLQIHLESPRYLPTLYDLITQAPLLRIEEHPISLADILRHISPPSL